MHKVLTHTDEETVLEWLLIIRRLEFVMAFHPLLPIWQKAQPFQKGSCVCNNTIHVYQHKNKQSNNDHIKFLWITSILNCYHIKSFHMFWIWSHIITYATFRDTLACPEIRQRVQIFALIKPIGLHGTINAQKSFGPLRHILTPPPLRRSSDVRFAVWKRKLFEYRLL